MIAGGRWRDSLEGICATIEEAADACAYGFVKRGSHRPAAELGTSLAYDWLPIRHFTPLANRAEAFEDEFAPDAFGIQLLGAGYGGRLPDASRWNKEPVRGNAVLVSHVDLDKWFGDRLVPFGGLRAVTSGQEVEVPEYVARARDDFAPIHLRDEHLGAR